MVKDGNIRVQITFDGNHFNELLFLSEAWNCSKSEVIIRLIENEYSEWSIALGQSDFKLKEDTLEIMSHYLRKFFDHLPDQEKNKFYDLLLINRRKAE